MFAVLMLLYRSDYMKISHLEGCLGDPSSVGTT